MLPVVWHFGVNSGYITPNEIAELLSERVSRIMGLFPQKGRLDVGSDADVVIFDPTENWIIRNDNQHSNATYTLFEGMELLGRVRSVLSRGELVCEKQQFLGMEGRGRFLSTSAGQFRRQ